MTIRHLLILAVLVAAVAWAVAMRGSRSDAANRAAAPAPAPAPAPAHGRVAAAPVSRASAPPPMAGGDGRPPSPPGETPAWRVVAASEPAGRSRADDPVRQERQARMAAVKRALDQLAPQDRQDPRKVSDTLQAVEKANGSPNLNGIRLDVLRQNLAVAAELQTLTTELQAMRGEIPEGRQPSPALLERIKAKLAQIGAAQKRIRADFMDSAQPLASSQ